VSFINFASSRLAASLNERAFALLKGLQAADDAQARYEQQVADTQLANRSVRRVERTVPSHALEEYTGSYLHPAYGPVEIGLQGERLYFVRGTLSLPLEHWHFDAWVVADNDLFEIHKRHAFDRTSRIVFETSADGDIAALSVQLEPAVAPARFVRKGREYVTPAGEGWHFRFNV